MSRPPLRVAVLGAGTVGRAVIEGMTQHPERLATSDGREICLTAVAVRELGKGRGDGIPRELLTDVPAHLVAGPEIDVIVELIGGMEPARTLIDAALGAGKAVVTANKAVIAHYGPALEGTARRTGATFRFEAAVGGGIPVLGTLASDLAANDIRRVHGIVNGTTNYILTAMAEDGAPYDEVLRDAQERGYAEADPSGDIEGDDAVNKLVILARLGFGTWLEPSTVSRRPPTFTGFGNPGITGVTSEHIACAREMRLSIRLLATATRVGDGVEAAVLPSVVAADSSFGATAGVTNRVEIDAEPLGTIALSGPGAGGAATSSAVLGDLRAIARGEGSTWGGLPPAVGPVTAQDPLSRAQQWLAVGRGTCLRTPQMVLEAARRHLKQTTARSDTHSDITIYPIDG